MLKYNNNVLSYICSLVDFLLIESLYATNNVLYLTLSSSGQKQMYDVVMETIDQDLPAFIGNIFTYATNPGLIMPAVLLMVYVSFI